MIFKARGKWTWLVALALLLGGECGGCGCSKKAAERKRTVEHRLLRVDSTVKPAPSAAAATTERVRVIPETEIAGVLPRTDETPVPPEGTVSPGALARVRSVLPKGWIARQDGAAIVVERIEPVELYSMIGMAAEVKDLRRRKETFKSVYKLWLHFGPPITRARYMQLVRENQALKRTLKAYYRKWGLSYGMGGLSALAAKGQRKTARYKQMKRRMHPLPVWRDAHSAIYAYSSIIGHWGFYSRLEALECTSAVKKVLGLFHPFDGQARGRQ